MVATGRVWRMVQIDNFPRRLRRRELRLEPLGLNRGAGIAVYFSAIAIYGEEMYRALHEIVISLVPRSADPYARQGKII